MGTWRRLQGDSGHKVTFFKERLLEFWTPILETVQPVSTRNENQYLFYSYKLQSLHIPYSCHYNPLLITNRSWILTIRKDRVFWKKSLKNKEMDFKNGVKNVQTAGYNSERTVPRCAKSFLSPQNFFKFMA